MLRPGRGAVSLGVAALGALVLLGACGSGSETSASTSRPATTKAPSANCQLTQVSVTDVPSAIATRPDAAVAPSDANAAALQKIDEIVGDGPEIKAGDCVVMNYVGVLAADGKPFDASWDHGGQLQTSIGVGSVIKGWDQGIPGMRVGGRRKLVIPGSLGYGAQGSPPKIPPNATLVFVVDAVAVQPQS